MGRAKIDLHLHLDGALDLQGAFRLATERGIISSDCSFERFCRQMSIPASTRNLAEYLRCFELPLAILQDEQALEESMMSLLERLEKQGLLYAEIRFAPQLHTAKGLSQRQVVEAVLQGKKRAEKKARIRSNLILCMMMVGPASFNEKENRETLRITKQFLGQGVVAADLAGDEEIAPLEEFIPLFETAARHKIPFVMHAGESGPPSNVALAIRLGARRIGHGGQCVKDPAILAQVVSSQIPLEMCVTSNLQCNSQPSYQNHALLQLYRHGAYLTMNTDNPTLSGITLESEMNAALNKMGLSEADLWQFTCNAIQAAFLSEEEKAVLFRLAKED